MKHFDLSVGVGLGGGFATIVLDHFNQFLGAVVGLLTVAHLVFKLIEDFRKTKK